MAAKAAANSPQPDLVTPYPVPTSFQVSVITDGNTGTRYAMLRIFTPTGQDIYFLDSATAKMVGGTLLRVSAATASSGLIVPPPLS